MHFGSHRSVHKNLKQSRLLAYAPCLALTPVVGLVGEEWGGFDPTDALASPGVGGGRVGGQLAGVVGASGGI